MWTILGTVGWLVLLAGGICIITAVTKESGVDLAPGWRLRCTKCNAHKPGKEVGMIRLGGVGNKHTIGFCRNCDRLRWIAIERVPVEDR